MDNESAVMGYGEDGSKLMELNDVSNEITPLSMLNRAVISGADVDVLERLMGLQERYEKRQAQRAFTAALAQVRSELPPIVKNREVDFQSKGGRTHYRYEDLSEIVEVVSPILAKYGLSFRWHTDSPSEKKVISVTCIVEHSEGHQERTTLTGPYDESGNKNAIQAIGSVVTYLQRYTLKASLGVAAGYDDDGAQKKHETTQGATPEVGQGATQGQIDLIQNLARNSLLTNEEKEKIEFAIEKGFTKKLASEFIERLKAKIDARRKGEVQPERNSNQTSETTENPDHGQLKDLLEWSRHKGIKTSFEDWDNPSVVANAVEYFEKRRAWDTTITQKQQEVAELADSKAINDDQFLILSDDLVALKKEPDSVTISALENKFMKICEKIDEFVVEVSDEEGAEVEETATA